MLILQYRQVSGNRVDALTKTKSDTVQCAALTTTTRVSLLVTRYRSRYAQ